MSPRTRKSFVDWPAVAVAFAKEIPHGALHPGALETAFGHFQSAQRENPRHRPRWAVAFSGGADSLALLLIFWAEGPGRWGRDFTVLHFNHRLRGRAAAADEKFCARVCRALGVKFIAGRWAEAHPKASEAEARTARMDFFHREMRRRRLTHLWLGHQQDDIAETMLMRLARGSGGAGLAAPRPAQAMPGGRWHMRPLLSLKKAQIVAALQGAGAMWREDATNVTGDFFRNRVRHEVVPAWQSAAQRDALAGAARSRELLEEDDLALETWLDELRTLHSDGSLDVRALTGKPRALLRRALHRWLLAQPQSVDLSRQGFDDLLAVIERGTPTRRSLGVGGFAVLHGGVLCFERAGKERRRFRGRAN